MARISLYKILYNIAKGYKTKTGDPGAISYGNVEEKVLSAIGSGGSEIIVGLIKTDKDLIGNILIDISATAEESEE